MFKMFIVGLLMLSCTPSFSTEYSFDNVKYVKNHDGDTITFNIFGVHPLIGDAINIRLSNIDTPELYTKNPAQKKIALEAKLYVQGVMEKAKHIRLENVKRGSFFRLIADVKVDGRDLAEMLKTRGYDEGPSVENTIDVNED